MELLAACAFGASALEGDVLLRDYEADGLGAAIGVAGDLDADGRPEIFVTAPSAAGVGRVAFYQDLVSTGLRPDFELFGAEPGAAFGRRAAAVGDIDGDGYGDFAVGAPLSTNGSVFLFAGGPRFDLEADWTLRGETEGERFGWSLAGLGDFDGDGFADLAVSAPYRGGNDGKRGFVHLFFGDESPDEMRSLPLRGEAAGDEFGGAIANAGDVNGDGFADLVVGANFNQRGGERAGSVYVYHGGPLLDDIPDRVFSSTVEGAFFGYAVASAGDVDRDGYADLLVGAIHDGSNGQMAGRAFLYSGGTTSTTPSLVFVGEERFDILGSAVAGLGDLDGDGFPDFAIAAAGSDAGGNLAGRVYVHRGGLDVDEQPDLILTGEGQEFKLGRALASMVSMDGDRCSELLVSGNDRWWGVDLTRALGVPGCEPQDRPLILFPNPARGRDLLLRIRPDEVGAARLSLYDLRGRLVARRQARLPGGGGQLMRWTTGELPAGSYMVELITPSGGRFSSRWIRLP